MKNNNAVSKKTSPAHEIPFPEEIIQKAAHTESEPEIRGNGSGKPATSTHFHILISLERLLKQETQRKKDYLSNSMDGIE